MRNTWILAADNSRARLYRLHLPDKMPHQMEEFENPPGRAHNRDLVTDGNGRYFGKGERNQGHTAPPGESAVEHEVELFAKRLVAHLEKARAEQQFDGLRIVAAPKFLGLLRQNMSKELAKVLEEAIAKDVTWFEDNALVEYLREKAA